MRNPPRRVLAWLALPFFLVAACAGVEPEAADLGRATIFLAEAPADVSCIVIRAVGKRTVEHQRTVVPGSSTVFHLGGLPVGEVQFEGEGFGVSCASLTGAHVPGWIADPVQVELATGGPPAPVTLNMRRNGRAEVTVDFHEEPTCQSVGTACSAGTQCCSLTCGADPTDPQGPTTCQPPSAGCPTGETDCGGSCHDLTLDPSNCGACGAACDPGEVCSSGACSPSCAPSTEVCDGVDNDCDGTVDEGNPGGGGACNTGQPGVCAGGTVNCTSGTLVCDSNQAPSTEVCDGLDNDCDGQVDEGNPGGGGACNTGQPGVCADGTVVCTSGALGCAPNQAPSTEACDGLDNDCDGAVDEGCP